MQNGSCGLPTSPRHVHRNRISLRWEGWLAQEQCTPSIQRNLHLKTGIWLVVEHSTIRVGFVRYFLGAWHI